MKQDAPSAPEIHPSKLAEYYNEVVIEGHGPQQTMKMPWEDLGLDAEERESLRQIASSAYYSLVHEKISHSFNSSIKRARALVERVEVFAGARHLVPAWRCPELADQIEEERQRYRWWLETEANIDECQQEVKGWFMQRAAVAGEKHGPDVERRVLEYVTQKIPDREQLLRWDYDVAVRPIALQIEGLDPNGVMARTAVRDAAVITLEIERRVRDRLLAVCEALARHPDLAAMAERGRKGIREAARYGSEHNVILNDPLVEEAANLLNGLATYPAAGSRRDLLRICGQLRAAKELTEHLTPDAVTRKPEPLAAIARRHLAPAVATAEQAVIPGLI